MREGGYRPKHASPVDWVPAAGIGAGLLLALTTAIVLVGGTPPVAEGRAGEPVATPPPAPPATAPAALQAEPPPGPREPTFAEAAEFAASYQPPGATAKRMVAANADDDSMREIVFASIVGGASRIDVAAWDGRGYRVVGTGEGGPATEIIDLWVRDVTHDRVREIIVSHRAERSKSVSIWGWDGAAYAPQMARGGCASGRNTFGVNGAEVGVGTIIATCDASPHPQKSVYTWNQRSEAWVFRETSA